MQGEKLLVCWKDNIVTITTNIEKDYTVQLSNDGTKSDVPSIKSVNHNALNNIMST